MRMHGAMIGLTAMGGMLIAGLVSIAIVYLVINWWARRNGL